MTSLLHHYFQAIQAVHGADDLTILHFQSQVNSLRVCDPKLILLFTKADWSAQHYYINFAYTSIGTIAIEKHTVTCNKMTVNFFVPQIQLCPSSEAQNGTSLTILQFAARYLVPSRMSIVEECPPA